MSGVQKQLTEALKAIDSHAKKLGAATSTDFASAAKPVLTWINWFRSCRPHSYAFELLDGAQSSVLEAASYAALGLGRATLVAIRTQIDLMLGFSYFREHPAEWRLLSWTGEGFKLRSEILKYHKEIDPGKGGFADRLAMLEQVCKPTLEDCYRVLSAHIHGQSPNTVPRASEMQHLVSNEPALQNLLKLQRESALALSVYFSAVHAREWNELPPEIVGFVKKELTKAQLPLFYSS